jgi:putative transposase
VTVHRIATALDPALAQEGERHYREAFDLIYPREADWPNSMWQADHTELDMLVLDPPRSPARDEASVLQGRRECGRARG